MTGTHDVAERARSSVELDGIEFTDDSVYKISKHVVEWGRLRGWIINDD